MRKEQVLSRMKEECLIAVIRAKNPEQGERIVEAVIAGGIHFIEITMTMDEGNPVEFISAMAAKYRKDDRIVIGAGTVLDPETARAVILAGANYVVSPGLNLDTIKLCNRYRVPMLPGVMTPTEAITALANRLPIITMHKNSTITRMRCPVLLRTNGFWNHSADACLRRKSHAFSIPARGCRCQNQWISVVNAAIVYIQICHTLFSFSCCENFSQ